MQPTRRILVGALAISNSGGCPAEDPKSGGTELELDASSESASGSESESGVAADDRSPGREVTVDTNVCSGTKMIQLTMRENYTVVPSLDISVTRVAPGQDLRFDWSDLTKDLGGVVLDPTTDIDWIGLMLFSTPAEGVAPLLTAGTIEANAFSHFLFYEVRGETHATLTDLGYFGEPAPPEALLLELVDDEVYPPSDHSHLLMAGAGDVGASNVRMMHLFTLDHSTENTEVRLDSMSTRFDGTVDLTSQPSLLIPARTTDIDLDWSAIVSIHGREGRLYPEDLTRVSLVRFDESRAELAVVEPCSP